MNNSEERNLGTGARGQVRVLFLGAARETVGSDELAISITSPATAGTAFEEVMTAFPALRQRFVRSLLFAVNQEYAPANRLVNEGDELAVFPPVSGGSDGAADTEIHAKDFFELTVEA